MAPWGVARRGFAYGWNEQEDEQPYASGGKTQYQKPAWQQKQQGW